MIFKIRKKFYAESADAVIKTPIGELFCKIASLPNGFYFYNKSGLQLAQVVFSDRGAELSLANSKPSFPGAVIMRADGNSFSFSGNEIGADDSARLGGIKGNGAAHAFSIWGKTRDYSYQIYDGSKLVGEVVPSSDPGYFEIGTTEHTNLLYALMITLAAEKLNER